MVELEHEINRSEVIADSEDEGLSGLKDDLQAAFYGDLSPEPELNPQDTVPWQIEASTSENALSISHTTTLPHIDLNTISNGASSSKPRPKPRRITKTNHTNDTLYQSTTGSLNDASGLDVEYPGYMSAFQVDMLPGSIADRAKTRQRKSKSIILEPIDAAGTPYSASKAPRKSAYNEVIELTDDDDDFSTKVSKKKPKKKPAPKTKKSPVNPLVDPDTSTSATLTEPKPKPRPKPRPLKRISPPSPLPFPDSTSQPTTNIPTSSLQAPIPFALAPSQLLQSDAPLPPTSTPPHSDLPRIETLPNPPTDGPPSSPSSLFSVFDPEVNAKSRDVDELESDHGRMSTTRWGTGMNIDDETASRISPPPTFFAPSSSSIGGRNASLVQSETVDLTILPPTMDPVAPVASRAKKAPPKASKARKKKGDAAADEIEAGVDGKKKPKAKGRAKKDKLQVEVVIPVHPPVSKGKEKEVFKSKEFINDEYDEDELDLLGPPPPPSKLLIKLPASKAKPNSLSSLSSVRISEPEDGSVAQTRSKKRTSTEIEDDNDNATIASPKKKAKGKATGKGKGKGKGKAVISETENEFEDAVVAAAKKAKGKGKSRRKPAFMSDEEEDAQEESVIHAQSDLKALDESRLKGASKKGKRNRIVQDDADDVIDASEFPIGNIPSEEATKENLEPPPKSSLTTAIPASGSGESSSKPDPPKKEPQSQYSSLTSRYTIAPRTKSTPMSELIRKVNSLPGSPFASPSPGLNRKRQSVGLAYSPYLKSSRSMLSKIAPLHPNRRTPPPPLPPPPPRKKTKKELEREEKWEEELIESVGGITEWACMTDAERKEMRKAKWEREMCGWDD